MWTGWPCDELRTAWLSSPRQVFVRHLPPPQAGSSPTGMPARGSPIGSFPLVHDPHKQLHAMVCLQDGI